MSAPIIGIYQICCTSNGRIYVGQAYDVQRRWRDHRSKLTNPKRYHHCGPLQQDWNLYGESSFVFTVVEQCGVAHLTERELYYYNLVRPELRYNMLPPGKSYARGNPAWNRGMKFPFKPRPTAKGRMAPNKGKASPLKGKPKLSMKGRPSPMAGKHHSLETRRKISEANKGKLGPNKGKPGTMLGRKWDHPYPKSGELSPRSKLTNFKVRVIRRLLSKGELNTNQIAGLFGVSNVTIASIKKGKTWKYVE
jgi:group I intron endonuclease